jgi:hypothetical protein
LSRYPNKQVRLPNCQRRILDHAGRSFLGPIQDAWPPERSLLLTPPVPIRAYPPLPRCH